MILEDAPAPPAADVPTPLGRSRFHLGEFVNFYPNDDVFEQTPDISDLVMKGLTPPTKIVRKDSLLVGFGSCFADHIQKYLKDRGYGIAGKQEWRTYVTHMSESFVNTFAILQQFEWALENKTPSVELWHDKSSNAVAYDEAVREATRKLFTSADVFIITLGLAEVWFDKPSGEVFWRAIPEEKHDPKRHMFRLSTYEENLANLRRIHKLIRAHNAEAAIVLTMSPIALSATFRPLGCIVANSASKSILRAAIDGFIGEVGPADDRLFYFPSYEVVLNCFNHSFMEDRRHVHDHVLNVSMKLFERHFCESDISEADIQRAYRRARTLDQRVGLYGHWAVPRRRARATSGARRNPPYLVRAVAATEWVVNRLGRALRIR
jgi:hypothetical protein